MQERRQAHLERRPRVGGRLDDGEDVLVERQGLAVALLLVADRRCELGQHVDEDAGVPREPQRLGRMGAEQELGELPQPVRRQPAADPLTRDVLDPRRPLAHLPQRVVVGIDIELRDEAKAADDPERVVAEACRPGRAEDAPFEIAAAAERVDDLPVSSRRAIALIVKSRRSMSCSSEISLSATISKSCLPGPVERSTRGGVNSIPAGWSARAAWSRGSSRTPTRWSATTRSSTFPCGSSAARSSSCPTPGTTKSSSGGVRPSSSSRTAPPTT